MIFEFGPYKVDIDIDATRAYYSVDDVNSCICHGCKNYRKYADECNPIIKEFFKKIGIEDLKYIAEITPFNTEEDGRVFYGGFYHLCGRVIESTCECIMYKITDNFEIWFSEECDLLADDFPEPSIQLNIAARIPWIIEEKNDY
ncbi:MAG: hypothetical protein ACI4PU_03645 [Intestinibacter sp.]